MSTRSFPDVRDGNPRSISYPRTRRKLAGISDPDVLAIAAEAGRILVTHDFRTMPKHFGEFLEAQGASPGVFLVKQRTPLAHVIDALVFVWAASDSDEWKNRILEIPLR